MIYKPYGKTGKDVSIIGFGGMRFDDKLPIEQNAQVIRYASELGINYFDTAPFYCNDTSEEIFGEAFKKMPNPFYVSTKSSINNEKTADDVRKRVENSLTRLGLDKITFFHMWCILDFDHYKRVIAPDGPYWGALKLKEEGLIEHLVFSTHANGKEIRMMVEDGKFEGVTLGYNAINFPYRQEGIEACFENNLGVVTMNPLGGGFIAENSQYFSFLKEQEDETTVQAAIRFNASHEAITVVLPGMATKEQVKTNVDAIKDLKTVSKEQITDIKSHLKGELNEICTTCQYCKHCPVNINIPTYMEVYNMNVLQGLSGAKTKYDNFMNFNRIKLSEPLPKDCIKCGKCERLCTQKLDIINRLDWISNNIQADI